MCACLLRSWLVVVGGRHSCRISVWVGSCGCLQRAMANAAASVSHVSSAAEQATRQVAVVCWVWLGAAAGESRLLASQATEPSVGAGPCTQCPAVKSRADTRSAQLPRLRAGWRPALCKRQPDDFGDWRAVTHLLGAKREEEWTRCAHRRARASCWKCRTRVATMPAWRKNEWQPVPAKHRAARRVRNSRPLLLPLRVSFWWSARLVKGAARAWVCLRLGVALSGSVQRRMVRGGGQHGSNEQLACVCTGSRQLDSRGSVLALLACVSRELTSLTCTRIH